MFDMTQPLKGVKVLELSTMITAALPSMILASQGAEVIKIEPLSGDPMRQLGAQKNGISALFHNCNRGKQSLALDLKQKQAQHIVQELAAEADILVHNYRLGVMDRLDLGSEALRAANPRLIYIAITGFGKEGEMAQNPAYDHVVQAIAGFTALQGDGEAMAHMKTLICDKTTGMTVAQAMLSALYAREKSGQGQHIDISMLHAALAFLWPDGMMSHSLLDDDVMNLPPMADYFSTITLTDAVIATAGLTDEHMDGIAELLDMPDLRSDARFKTLPDRMVNMNALMEKVTTARPQKSLSQAQEILGRYDVPMARAIPLSELGTLAQVQAIGAVEEYHTDNLGHLRAPTPPIQFMGEATQHSAAAPSLGGDNETILSTLGHDIKTLREQGVAL